MSETPKLAFEQVRIARHLVRWSLLVLPVSVAVGGTCELAMTWPVEVLAERLTGNWQVTGFAGNTLLGMRVQFLTALSKSLENDGCSGFVSTAIFAIGFCLRGIL